MGQVLQAGQGQITARQAAVKAGIPMTVPGTTVNKVCLSGLNAIYLADQMINAGDADIVVAGGMESMTNAPYLLPGARAGYRMGDQKVVDSMMFDGLWDAFDTSPWAPAPSATPAEPEITRERQDAFAAASHERAAAAIKDGRFADEIVAGQRAPAQGRPVMIETDEGVRPGTTTESLGRAAAGVRQGRHHHRRQRQPDLRRRGGRDRHVAGRGRARSACAPLGEVVGYGQVAGPDTSLLTQPSRATARALERAGLRLSDVDLFEFNEAFAAVGLASMDDLGVSDDVVNVNGGAIALGHPIGMSGTRLALTLLHELGRRGGGLGAAALCGGGGQGDALVITTR